MVCAMNTPAESAYEPGVERLKVGLNDGEEPSLIRSHSASVRSVGYGLAVIPPVYRTGATYGRLFKQPLNKSSLVEFRLYSAKNCTGSASMERRRYDTPFPYALYMWGTGMSRIFIDSPDFMAYIFVNARCT